MPSFDLHHKASIYSNLHFFEIRPFSEGAEHGVYCGFELVLIDNSSYWFGFEKVSMQTLVISEPVFRAWKFVFR